MTNDTLSKDTLTTSERARFDELEAVIQDGLDAFIEVGNALAEVKEERLWREDYDSWNDYTQERWELAGSTAYQRIHAAQTNGRLKEADVKPPSSTRANYELRDVPDADLPEALERARKIGNGNATASAAKQAAEEFKDDQEEEGSNAEEQRLHPDGDLDGYLDDHSGSKRTENTLLAVPHDLDARPYLDISASTELAHYATPVGNANVEETAYPLEVIERPRELAETVVEHVRDKDRAPGFNGQSDHIDWANQTVNPLTGCHHTCGYCYARTIATEGRIQYAQGFHPTFHPSRLVAFERKTAPSAPDDVREKNVFCDSMSDLFGTWVPKWMIQMTLDAVGASDWNGLFLTKYPKRFEELDFPDNAMIGVTVDGTNVRPKMVEATLPGLGKDRPTTWISAEPLQARVEFSEGFLKEWIDCVVIGARQYLPGQEPSDEDLEYGTHRQNEGGRCFQQPPREDIEHLHSQARKAGCAVYWKDNLQRPKELPAF
jgi:protein gp37/ribosomal protein L12E/L44/L45/RPP1/RPP2